MKLHFVAVHFNLDYVESLLLNVSRVSAFVVPEILETLRTFCVGFASVCVYLPALLINFS